MFSFYFQNLNCETYFSIFFTFRSREGEIYRIFIIFPPVLFFPASRFRGCQNNGSILKYRIVHPSIKVWFKNGSNTILSFCLTNEQTSFVNSRTNFSTSFSNPASIILSQGKRPRAKITQIYFLKINKSTIATFRKRRICQKCPHCPNPHLNW